MRTVRINEYYDLFDVKQTTANVFSIVNNESLPTENKPTFNTNAFSGFNNFEQTSNYSSVDNIGSAYNPPPTNTGSRDLIQVVGKHRAPQANNSLSVDEQGNILCYPPPVSVPWWDKVIFRNFDYTITNDTLNNIKQSLVGDRSNITFSGEEVLNPYYSGNFIPENFELELSEDDITQNWTSQAVMGRTYTATGHTPGDHLILPLWGVSTATAYKTKGATAPYAYPTNFSNIYQHDFGHTRGFKASNATFNGTITNYSESPLFLKFDNYQSRSKVIFSGCDKTRNPDIEFKFGYQHGNMEPIKLNLALSASNPLVSNVGSPNPSYDRFNQNLTREQIEAILVKCYWCIEWIYEPRANVDL